MHRGYKMPCYKVDTPRAVLDWKLLWRKPQNLGARKDLTNQLIQSPHLIEEEVGAHTFELINSIVCPLARSSVILDFWESFLIMPHSEWKVYV